MIGRAFGRYRVVGRLGDGGFATVWKAEDTLLSRPVALKVLAESATASPPARRRFLHEARAAAALSHPGIAAVHDSGEQDGRLYIVFDYVDGETLADRLRSGPLPPTEAARIGIAAAEALGHAHSRGVIHRDVSSANLALSGDGRVVVLDFGLALAGNLSRITRSGTTLGTIDYVAPEVARGDDAGPASDVFGLGVVLYEALTGRLPFSRDRVEGTLHAIVHEEPGPPRALRPEIPVALEAAVMRALAKSPAHRYSTGDAFAAALRAAVG